MSISLKNKIALVIGGSGQIGAETIDILLKSGALVINLDVKNKKFKSKKYYFHKIDITDEKQIIEFKKKFLKKYKKLNILINHAHYKGNTRKLDPNNSFFSSLDNYPSNEWKKTLEVNLNGMFFLTKHFIKVMLRSKNPVILNTSSIYGKVSPNKAIYGKSGINSPVGYTATKAAIIGFTKYIAAHYGEKGLRANVLVPGGVENKSQSSFFKKNYSKLTPLKRMSKKNDFKEAVLFLVSDKSSYMTGSEIVIDGGWTIW